MSEKIQITEEDKIHEAWYEEAKKQTLETLPNFLKSLSEDYGHDYGTICHALAAAGIGAMWAIDKGPSGGITGFQAGCIMWEFVRNWLGYKEQPLSLVNYENMLFPQYDYKFQKTISPDTWQWLQDKAKENLENLKEDDEFAANRVVEHWKSIVTGNVPFGFVISEE